MLAERAVVLSKVMGGIVVSSRAENDVLNVKRIAVQNRFDDTVKAHNMDQTRHHFDEHEFFFTSYQFDHLLHFGMMTGYDMLNVARAINAGSSCF